MKRERKCSNKTKITSNNQTKSSAKSISINNKTNRISTNEDAVNINTLSNAQAKPVKWDKTDHSFVDKKVLNSYRRKLGDALVEKGYLSLKELPILLKIKAENETLGDCLIREGMISESQLIEGLSYIEGIQVLNDNLLDTYDLNSTSSLIDEKLLNKHMALPILQRGNSVVIACTYKNYDKIEYLLSLEKWKVTIVLARKSTIEYGLYKMFNLTHSPVCLYCENRNDLELSQIVIVKNYALLSSQEEEVIAKSMGLSQT